MKKGFTLIELLVVISIIGVLTAVLMMNLVGARGRAADTKKIQDLNSLKSALRMYYNDNNTYPSSLSVLGSGSSYVSGLGDMTGVGYTVTNSGDGFILTTSLEVGAGTQDTESQTKCGISPTSEKVYAVCAD